MQSRSGHSLMLYNICSWKFCKICSKTPALELFFNKVAGLQACNFIKEFLTQLFSWEFFEIFITTFFIRHLQTTASSNKILQKSAWMKTDWRLSLLDIHVANDLSLIMRSIDLQTEAKLRDLNSFYITLNCGHSLALGV